MRWLTSTRPSPARTDAPPAHRENVQLSLGLDPATGHIRADAGQLDQIVVNLVVNARDAMPNGGTVTIETGNVSFEEPYATEHFDVRRGRTSSSR